MDQANPNDMRCVRGWCMDYALRTPRAENPTAKQVIADAKEYERYVTGTKSGKVMKLVKAKK